ncbi:hypothetical protein BKA70DRAFT_1276858 [Coprinopsis sp. MPI-PUGE-AT-0042]|nr:hypothetical protein BKA70DRAFT_1276858 [Coprinopsis sp. MPI-PUGE-AT-0042]
MAKERNDNVPALEAKNITVMLWSESEACENVIKGRSGRSAEPRYEWHSGWGPLGWQRTGASAPIQPRKRQAAYLVSF